MGFDVGSGQKRCAPQCLVPLIIALFSIPILIIGDLYRSTVLCVARYADAMVILGGDLSRQQTRAQACGRVPILPCLWAV
jgi:hypothetical protein